MFIVFHSCITPSNGNILMLYFKHNIWAVLVDGRWSHQCVWERGIGQLMPTKWGIKMILWVVLNLKLLPLHLVEFSSTVAPGFSWFIALVKPWHRTTCLLVTSLSLSSATNLQSTLEPERTEQRCPAETQEDGEGETETETEERDTQRMWNLSAAAQLLAWMLLL